VCNCNDDGNNSTDDNDNNDKDISDDIDNKTTTKAPHWMLGRRLNRRAHLLEQLPIAVFLSVLRLQLLTLCNFRSHERFKLWGAL
jgi:hypothetical protein